MSPLTPEYGGYSGAHLAEFEQAVSLPVIFTGPRTEELPMAFTTWEFVRGALITYGLFLGFTALAWMWTFWGVIIAIWYVAPFGFASLILVGVPLAYLTGMLLRREVRTGVHLFWHGLVGLVAGGAGVVFALCIVGQGGMWTFSAPHLPDFSLLAGVWIIALVEALLTVGAAMSGWWITSKRALAAPPAGHPEEA